jgi:hypothetical protein
LYVFVTFVVGKLHSSPLLFWGETFHLFFQRIDWKTFGIFLFFWDNFQYQKELKQETYSSSIQDKSIKEYLRW